MSYTAPKKDPTYRDGERVTLKADPRSNPWRVIGTHPSGTVRIQREGREPSIYSQMNVLPTNLKRAGETPLSSPQTPTSGSSTTTPPTK